MSAARPPRWACRSAVLSVGLLSACRAPLDGGLHHENEYMVQAAATYGDPIVGHAIAWVADGDVPNTGIAVQGYWFTKDRTAVGVGLNALRFQVDDDEDPHGLEGQLRLRYYMVEAGPAAFFADLSGGYMWTSRPIPPGGTQGNGTFSFGPGVEIPVYAGASLLLGGEFHHMSNGRGRYAEDNPAQNESLWSVGVGWRW